MELHCPVVCFTKSIRILIAKRSDDRKVFPGKWEFGAAKPDGNTKMIDTLKKEYFDDFNIKILPFKDDQENPIPISSYEVERDGELHKGIIFAAFIPNISGINSATDKHSEIKVVKMDELLSLPDEDCVPTLKKAAVNAYCRFSDAIKSLRLEYDNIRI